ncbi:hypothetical protein N0M98_27375 [Paenibacillus doosanensis]|uniref:hypothetical protein n=1 Tax=Paenibacillus doosanensis TaxID=1229154 RepID=UPI00218096CA|nr:hypothetical protein [Paenibacillus doosanensis]MCS7463832.1 hypothetical protein [Paenibacillus doosanensis]
MIPEAGDIYCVYVERLRSYAACQITHIKLPESAKGKPLAAVLELDWLGDAPPSESELRQMKPLICNYFFWNDRIDHSYVDAVVPAGYTKVGSLPPLAEEEVVSYGSWDTGGSMARQRNWEAIDPKLRQRFKEAAQDRAKVDVGGRSLSRSTSAADEDLLRQLSDLSELEKLPCLTRIHADTLSEPLLAFIAGNPFIIELQVSHVEGTDLDLSACRLNRLAIRPEGLRQLTLNRDMRQLTLTGPASPELRIAAEEDGRWLTVHNTAKLPALIGLDRLGGLHLTGIASLDLTAVVRRFPALRELRLWGKPGTLTGMDSLAALPELQRFSTYDLFGFTGEQFPGPDKLPRLEWLWMTSLPAEAAGPIKARYKKQAAAGLDLHITKARKTEWLAENLDNPFRDWDGREHISAANARKAASLYKKTQSALRSLALRSASAGPSDAAVREELEALVAAYTETFNRMDRRGSFIETVEREEIYTVLTDLLQNFQAAGGQADVEALVKLFDSLRDY